MKTSTVSWVVSNRKSVVNHAGFRGSIFLGDIPLGFWFENHVWSLSTSQSSKAAMQSESPVHDSHIVSGLAATGLNIEDMY